MQGPDGGDDAGVDWTAYHREQGVERRRWAFHEQSPRSRPAFFRDELTERSSWRGMVRSRAAKSRRAAADLSAIVHAFGNASLITCAVR